MDRVAKPTHYEPPPGFEPTPGNPGPGACPPRGFYTRPPLPSRSGAKAPGGGGGHWRGALEGGVQGGAMGGAGGGWEGRLGGVQVGRFGVVRGGGGGGGGGTGSPYLPLPSL